LRPCGGRRGRLGRLLMPRGRRDRDGPAHAVGGLLGLGCMVLWLRLGLRLLLRLLLCRRWRWRPRRSLRAGTGNFMSGHVIMVTHDPMSGPSPMKRDVRLTIRMWTQVVLEQNPHVS